MNIFSYVKTYGNKSFKEMPFNDIDSLVFCSLSYVHFDLVMEGFSHRFRSNKYKISDLLNLEYAPDLTEYDLVHQTVLVEKSLFKLLPLIKASKRFGDIEIGYLESMLDVDYESQFFALTFFLDDGTMFVTYRGTDDSLIGWKEDLNMAHQSIVPGQIKAGIYINSVLKFEGDKKYYIGGHSKGGNFAYFAANMVNDKYFDNLIKVFDHDGPGFKSPEIIFKQERKLLVDTKSIKTMPHASIVGSLLHHDIETKIIKSRQISLLQHDLFSWCINPKTLTLVYLTKRSLVSKVNEEAVKKLLKEMTDEDIKLVSDCLLDLLGGCNMSLFDILRYPLATIKYWRKKYHNYPEEKRHKIYAFISTLGKSWYNAMLAAIRNKN